MGSRWTEVGLLQEDTSLAPSAHAARSIIARMIADGSHVSRSEIVRATGLARSTVDKHLAVLLDARLIEDAGLGRQDARGRPPQIFRVSAARGVVLVADVSFASSRIALTTLDQVVLAERVIAAHVDIGPENLLSVLAEAFDELLVDVQLSKAAVLAVSVGLPGPVDSHLGEAVRPPRMPGWDGFGVCRFLATRFQADVIVDNNVNLRALGEARASTRDRLPLLMIFVDEGVGGGFVGEDGRILHGADGAAADIGHIQVPSVSEAQCPCGNFGCLEAVASAGAIAERLSVMLGEQVGVERLLESLARGEAATVRLVREAAIVLGGVVANLVNFCNPARIVLGGQIAQGSEDLLAQVRSVTYQQAQPLATRKLSLAHCSLGDEGGLIGGMVSGIEQVLSPRGIAYHTRSSNSTMRPLGL